MFIVISIIATAWIVSLPYVSQRQHYFHIRPWELVYQTRDVNRADPPPTPSLSSWVGLGTSSNHNDDWKKLHHRIQAMWHKRKLPLRTKNAIVRLTIIIQQQLLDLFAWSYIHIQYSKIFCKLKLSGKAGRNPVGKRTRSPEKSLIIKR